MGKSLALGLLVLLVSSSPARAEPAKKSVMVGAGLGMGELVHAELGVFVGQRLLVEARAGWLIFNPMVGAALSYSFGSGDGEGPPRHGWLVRGEAMMNPTLGEFRIEERGETIGAYLGSYFGYAFVGDGSVYFRLLAGVLVGKENQVGVMGPNFTATLGLAF